MGTSNSYSSQRTATRVCIWWQSYAAIKYGASSLLGAVLQAHSDTHTRLWSTQFSMCGCSPAVQAAAQQLYSVATPATSEACANVFSKVGSTTQWTTHWKRN